MRGCCFQGPLPPGSSPFASGTWHRLPPKLGRSVGGTFPGGGSVGLSGAAGADGQSDRGTLRKKTPSRQQPMGPFSGGRSVVAPCNSASADAFLEGGRGSSCCWSGRASGRFGRELGRFVGVLSTSVPSVFLGCWAGAGSSRAGASEFNLGLFMEIMRLSEGA
jgi:hypothetical protein